MSSAALPALHFLLEALELDDPQLRVELLDILAGFAEAAGPGYQGPRELWQAELRATLVEEHTRFERLRATAGGDVADFADWVIQALATELG